MVRELVGARRARVAAPVHELAPRSCSPRTPTRCSSSNGPGDPAALAYIVDDRPRARRRASPCGASASATSCCAGRWAWRPSSCRSATAAPTTRSATCRPGAWRSPPRTTASPRSARAARARSTATSRCAGRPTSAPPRSPTSTSTTARSRASSCSTCPAGRVQYHPEAGPGPHDSLYLFDRFLRADGIADGRPA